MLKDIILERRSVRKYDQTKTVPRELLEELFMYSLMGPSAGNARPIEYVVVEDKETIEKLSDLESFATLYLKDVPQIVVVVANTELSKTWVEEGSICASYFQLLAQEAGLNTCWINVKDGKTASGEDMQDYMKKLLNLPKNYKSFCLIPLGYGKDRVRKREEFDVKEKVHYNKF